MRVKVEYRSASREVFKRFCEAHPDVKISFAEWAKIIYTYNYLFRDHVLESGDRVKMPNGLGLFAINKKKIKTYKNFKDKNGKPYVNLRIDWAMTKKAGKRVYHMNKHTDGHSYKWLWLSKEARFFLSDIWNFTAARKSSRLLGTYLKKPNSIYAQLYKTWSRK
jgi:nucleoid DNA-binding protein